MLWRCFLDGPAVSWDVPAMFWDVPVVFWDVPAMFSDVLAMFRRFPGGVLRVFWDVLAMFGDVLRNQHSVQSGQGPHPHTGNLVVSTEDMFCGTFPDDQCT